MTTDRAEDAPTVPLPSGRAAWAPPDVDVTRPLRRPGPVTARDPVPGTASAPVAVPRLERSAQDRVLGGVAAGLAEHLGVGVRGIRAAFAVLTVLGGSGLVLYGAFWVVLPLRREDPATVPDPARRRRSRREAAGLALAVLAAFAVVAGSGAAPVGLVPLALVATGAAVLWRQADEAQRARWRATARAPYARPRRLVTALVGAALLVAGLAGFLASRGELAEAREGLLATAVVVAGLGLLTAPLVTRVLTDLRAERAERIRSEERAEIAARLHDSVLQTLALVQRNADDPREVARLARVQERELRGWLYGPAPTPEATVARCLEQAMAEVEEAHGTPVEVVVVGDAPYDDRVAALVAAAREAAVNAAKHSGAPRVQVYAEVEPERVEVFVRDRGRGFDPDAVGEDRFGLRQSVVARTERVGGRAHVRSGPGRGTEVRLELPRG